ncbi:Uncharacterised protein [Mycobacteroides abscessus subsp. abscessus]|nr:Uncharacterised protein [Mycobacteroides abscessus subsp. abscessus]
MNDVESSGGGTASSFGSAISSPIRDMTNFQRLREELSNCHRGEVIRRRGHTPGIPQLREVCGRSRGYIGDQTMRRLIVAGRSAGNTSTEPAHRSGPTAFGERSVHT